MISNSYTHKHTLSCYSAVNDTFILVSLTFRHHSVCVWKSVWVCVLFEILLVCYPSPAKKSRGRRRLRNRLTFSFLSPHKSGYFVIAHYWQVQFLKLWLSSWKSIWETRFVLHQCFFLDNVRGFRTQWQQRWPPQRQFTEMEETWTSLNTASVAAEEITSGGGVDANNTKKTFSNLLAPFSLAEIWAARQLTTSQRR